MIRAIHQLLILLTVLALASYGSAASARAAGLTQMVICGSLGAQTIWLDGSGEPAEAPKECCDCLDCISVTDACLPGGMAVKFDHLAPACVAALQPADPRRTFPCPAPMPRGPPLLGHFSQLAPRMTAEPELQRIAHTPLDFHQVICGQSVAERRANHKDARV